MSKELTNDELLEFDWYQCDIIEKDGKRVFLARFIARGYEDAKQRIGSVAYDVFKRSLLGIVKKYLFNYHVKEFDIFKVPNKILKQYNFLKPEEVDAFHEQVRG